MNYDIVTFGESMLRLSPPNNSRIEQSTAFNLQVAGSESNTAVGLARLGAQVCWFSRLPNTSLGHLVVNDIRKHGVHTNHVIWTDDERLGLYFVEDGIAPRPTQVIYDRAQSAMSAIQVQNLPATIFQEGYAKVLHVTGITLALSQSAMNAVLKAVDLAKRAGWRISFDVNYRSKLWSVSEARLGCETCLEVADIIFFPIRDACQLFDYDEALPVEAVLADMHRRYPNATIVMSNGASGSICCDINGEIVAQDAFPVAGKYRIGAGDAFSAGFLYSHICREDNLQTALAWGNAVAALKFTMPGDMPLVDKLHVQQLIDDAAPKQIVR